MQGSKGAEVRVRKSVLRLFVASGLAPDVKGNVADKLRRYTRTRKPFAALEHARVIPANPGSGSRAGPGIPPHRHSGESRNPA